MKMNNQNKLIIGIGGAIVACLLVGAAVYFTLKGVATKNNPPSTGEVTTPETRENKLAKEAEAQVEAGEDAFNTRNPAEAVEKFKAAKKLYEQAGDTTKAEQMADQIAVAEHEVKTNPESEPQPAPENPAPPEETIGGEAAKASSEN